MVKTSYTTGKLVEANAIFHLHNNTHDSKPFYPADNILETIMQQDIDICLLAIQFL